MTTPAISNVTFLSPKEEELEITEADLDKIRLIRARYARMREEIGRSLIGAEPVVHQLSDLKNSLK